MKGKGGTVAFTSPRLQVRVLRSNPVPDHHSDLPRNYFKIFFYDDLLYYFCLEHVCECSETGWL